MTNLLKSLLLLTILSLNVGFMNLNLFQKKSAANQPFKIIRTSPDGSGPDFFGSDGDLAFFTTSNGDNMVTDGTVNGTQPLSTALINLPWDSVFMGEFLGVDIFYSDSNNQYWRSDKTLIGTFPLGPVGSFSYRPPKVFLGNAGATPIIYALGNDSSYDPVIFQSDGTISGTYITPAPVVSWWSEDFVAPTANGLAIVGTGGSELYVFDFQTQTMSAALATFSGYDYGRGQSYSNGSIFYFPLHLWGVGNYMFATDGTSGGTYQLETTTMMDGTLQHIGFAGGKDIFLGQPSGNQPTGATYRFYTSNGSSTSDWTQIANTTYDFHTSSYSVDFALEVNSKVVVRLVDWGQGYIAGSSPIWITDGTPGGTQIITGNPAIHAATDSNLSRSDFKAITFDNKIIFQGYTVGTGHGIWSYDGSVDPISVLGGITFMSGVTTQSIVTNNYFVFPAIGGATGAEYYRSDGTAGGTYLLQDINSGASNGVTYNYNMFNGGQVGTSVVFGATDLVNGTELWITDGTSPGTTLLKAINPNPGSSQISDFVVSGSNFFFTARDDSHGTEPWVSDGTNTGTHMITDIIPGSTGSSPYSISPINANSVIFQTWSSGTDYADLWISDGTSPNTQVVMSDVVVSEFVTAGPYAYFVGYDGTNGQQLWKTDGTLGNTAMIADINGGNGSNFDWWIGWFNPFGNSVLFYPTWCYWGSDLACNPWISDGTPSGTLELLEILPLSPNGGSYPQDGLNLGTKFIFSAYDTSDTYRIYVTDGTPSGTGLLKDIYPAGDPQLGYIDAVNNLALFTADDGVNGQELWVTDGTTGATQMLMDISSGSASTTFSTVATNDGSFVYFFANPSGQTWELWKSDGTVPGTSSIFSFGATDTIDGAKMITAGPYLFFQACTTASGCELWRSDKTPSETRLFWDTTPGAASTTPTGLLYFNNLVFFQGAYKSSGSAIWATGINSH